jgi:hypothetical protein
MNKAELKRRIAGYTYRTIVWGNNHVPPGLRTLLGFAFMVGGVFGFLPVLGFWMFPLGMAFVALDIPPLRQRIDLWLLDLYRRAQFDGEHKTIHTPTSRTSK